MYLLSDFFIVTPEEAAALDVRSGPLPDSTTVPGIVSIQDIRELAAILFGYLTKGPSLMPDWPTPGMTEDDAWAIPIPPQIPYALAYVDDRQLGEWASAWDEAMGWTANGVSPDLAASLVTWMAELARQAEETGRVMYVWLCEGE
jgi:hypothetical protein